MSPSTDGFSGVVNPNSKLLVKRSVIGKLTELNNYSATVMHCVMILGIAVMTTIHGMCGNV